MRLYIRSRQLMEKSPDTSCPHIYIYIIHIHKPHSYIHQIIDTHAIVTFTPIHTHIPPTLHTHIHKVASPTHSNSYTHSIPTHTSTPTHILYPASTHPHSRRSYRLHPTLTTARPQPPTPAPTPTHEQGVGAIRLPRHLNLP